MINFIIQILRSFMIIYSMVKYPKMKKILKLNGLIKILYNMDN